MADYKQYNLFKAVKLLISLLHPERKEIWLIYFYAVIAGAFSLVLPVGTQAIVNIISSNWITISVWVIIAGVILAVGIQAWVQIIQISFTEIIQRKVMASVLSRMVRRFSFQSSTNNRSSDWPPEIANLFFEVPALQKTMPKVLVEFTQAIMQVLFGLILLSLYHPVFLIAGLGLVGILVVYIIFTGNHALRYGLKESTDKYHLAYNLQLSTYEFISAGTVNASEWNKYIAENLTNYLRHRTFHFGVTIQQYKAFLVFKMAITGVLLVLGAVLVASNEVSVGQFVGSEIIIILTINSIEKIVQYLETFYDSLVAAIKIDLALKAGSDQKLPSKELRWDHHRQEINIQLANPQRNLVLVSQADMRYLLKFSSSLKLADHWSQMANICESEIIVLNPYAPIPNVTLEQWLFENSSKLSIPAREYLDEHYRQWQHEVLHAQESHIDLVARYYFQLARIAAHHVPLFVMVGQAFGGMSTEEQVRVIDEIHHLFPRTSTLIMSVEDNLPQELWSVKYEIA